MGWRSGERAIFDDERLRMRQLKWLVVSGMGMCVAATCVAQLVTRSDAAWIERIQNKQVELPHREAAVVELSRRNAAENVPILIELLNDSDLEKVARSSLVSMQGKAIDETLRAHLTKEAQPRAKLIEIVGLRRDEAAVDRLEEWLSHSDATVVRAAAMALAEIGTDEAGQRLDRAFRLGVSPRVYVIADAYVHYARRLAERDRAQAREVLNLVIDGYLPSDYRLRALKGAIELEDEGSVELMKSLLHSSDDTEFELAVECVALFMKPAAPEWLREEVSRLEGPRRETLEASMQRKAAAPAK